MKVEIVPVGINEKEILKIFLKNTIMSFHNMIIVM
jgi:hypothetical protein